MSDCLLYLSMVAALAVLALIGLWWDRRRRPIKDWRYVALCLAVLQLDWQDLSAIVEALQARYQLSLGTPYVAQNLDQLTRAGLVESRIIRLVKPNEMVQKLCQYRLTKAGQRCQRWSAREPETALMI